MILVIENNRFQTITITLSFQTYTISIDTSIDLYRKKKLYTKTFGFIDYDCPNPWSSKKRPSLRYKFLDNKSENISLFNVSASPYII